MVFIKAVRIGIIFCAVLQKSGMHCALSERPVAVGIHGSKFLGSFALVSLFAQCGKFGVVFGQHAVIVFLQKCFVIHKIRHVCKHRHGSHCTAVNAVLYSPRVPIFVVELQSRHSKNIVHRIIRVFVNALFGGVLRTQGKSPLVGERFGCVDLYLALIFLIELLCDFLIGIGILSVARKPYVYLNIVVNYVTVCVTADSIVVLPPCVQSDIALGLVCGKIPLLGSRRVLVPARMLHKVALNICGNILFRNKLVPFHARSNAYATAGVVVIKRNYSPALGCLPRSIEIRILFYALRKVVFVFAIRVRIPTRKLEPLARGFPIQCESAGINLHRSVLRALVIQMINHVYLFARVRARRK